MTKTPTHTISTTVAGTTLSLDTSKIKWSDDFVRTAIGQGLAVKMQRASAGKNGDEAVTATRELIASLLKGEWPSGGAGGARVTPQEREARAIVAAALEKLGEKPSEAQKIARKVRDAIGYIVTKKSPELDGDDYDEKVESMYETVMAEAKKRADALADFDL